MFCLETQMCRGEIDEGDWMKAINNREWWWWGKQNKWSLWSIIHYLGRVINILQCLRYCNIFRISENPIQRIYVFCEKVHAKNKAHWGWGCACCISTKIWVRSPRPTSVQTQEACGWEDVALTSVVEEEPGCTPVSEPGTWSRKNRESLFLIWREAVLWPPNTTCNTLASIFTYTNTDIYHTYAQNINTKHTHAKYIYNSCPIPRLEGILVCCWRNSYLNSHSNSRQVN